MNPPQDRCQPQAVSIDPIGPSGRNSSAEKRLVAAGLLLSCMSMANAALIEMPGVQSDRGYANDGRRQLLSWQENALYQARLNAYGVLQATANGLVGRSARPAMDLARVRGFSPHVEPAETGNAFLASDLYAAVDDPYGASVTTERLASDSDPELWTILIVAAGLIGYQIRRKSKFGAIRVRPLQY